MTYSEFQREGFELSEKQIKVYERRIEGYYSEAFKQINERIKNQWLKLTDVAPENYYNEMLKYNRLNEMLGQISEDYKLYAKKAGKDTIKALKEGMLENYNRQQFALAWSPVDAKYTVLPNSIIEAAVLGTDESIKNVTAAVAKKFGEAPLYMPQVGSLSKLIADNASKEISAIQRQVVNGLRNGQGYQKTARAVRDIIGRKVVNDGVTIYNGAMASAKRIIQTESTRVLNAASYANYRQAVDQGIEIVREWQAVLDMKTRDRHQSLDGQKADKQGFFHSDGDTATGPGGWSSAAMNINCRCSTIEYTEGMKPGIRTGRNPIKAENWKNATAAERRDGVTKDGVQLFSPGKQAETFSYRNYPEWLETVS